MAKQWNWHRLNICVPNRRRIARDFVPDSLKYVGTDNGPFDVPTQLLVGQIEGQNFYYHVSTDGKQTPIGFCGEDDYVGVCIHWEVFVPVGPKYPWAPGYFDVPSYCPLFLCLQR